jgi:uncharacterized protein (UPF0332 family)
VLSKEQINLSDLRFKKSKDALTQAKILLDNHMYDGCINRSYYSIFYAIRSLLALINADSSKHSGILALYDKHFVKTGVFRKEFSKIAHTAFDIRQDSDYDDFFYPREEEAGSQYRNTEKFVEEVENIRLAIISNQINLPSNLEK